MAVSTIVERLGRVLFEAGFGGQKIAKDAPELAEIRLAVLDAVKEKAHRAGGKIVFPYNVIRLHLLGVPADQAPVFRSTFLCGYFAEELRTNLTRSGYRFPSDLRVDVSTTEAMPDAGGNWLQVEMALEEPKQEAIAAVPGVGVLTVLSGTAQPDRLKLTKAHVNIGRTAEAVQAGGPTRRNDVAFSEGDEASRSVSRQHAHIERDAKSGHYRLFNDRVYKGAVSCGVYLVRGGDSEAVHRGGHGVILRAGDEIHLGHAVLRFEEGE